MNMQRRAARRFLDRGAILALAAASLLTAAAPLAAQQRQRPSDSGGGRSSGGESRVAVPRSAPNSGSSSSASRDQSSPPRTARPASPDDSGSSTPRRQPPTRHRGDRGGRGGGYYGGGYWGGYYGPSYYPWFWYRGYPYWYYGPGAYYYPYDRHGYTDRGTLGALDLDVSPGKAEIYLDGRYVGIADQYDGFPQYLWLEKGTYDVVLFRDGYRTVARQISIYPGMVISVDDRLEPGESTRPEEMMTPKSTERRDARLRDERERRERLEAEERDGRGGEDWRDRVREDRDRWANGEREGRRGWDRDEEGRDHDGHSHDGDRGGRLRLEVEPEDASIYLDGKFVGTASEMADLRSGLSVSPGKHKLAIVRPGHKAEELDFEVEAGKVVDLEIELESYE